MVPPCVSTLDLTIFLPLPHSFPLNRYAKLISEMNWRKGGSVLRTHQSPGDGVVTNVAIDNEYILVSLTNRTIHVFSSETGEFIRDLQGHKDGVWALHLVSKGGKLVPPPSQIGSQTPSTSRSDSPNCLRHGSSMAFGASANTTCSSSNLWSRSNSPAGPPTRCTASPKLSTRSSPVEGSDGECASYRARLGLGAARQSDVCNASYGWGNAHAIALTGSCDRDV